MHMNYSRLRQYIRNILIEKSDNEDTLLVEPDLTPEREDEDKAADEVSALGTAGAGGVGSIRGVTTPLGTGPTYPAGKKKRKKKRTPAEAAGSGFGGAKPYDPKKLKN